MADNYRYALDLTRLINERIDKKNIIAKLGNDVFKINIEIQSHKKKLAKIEKEIDNKVMGYNKKNGT